MWPFWSQSRALAKAYRRRQSKSCATPWIWLSAPLSRLLRPLGVQWRQWWLRRDICGLTSRHREERERLSSRRSTFVDRAFWHFRRGDCGKVQEAKAQSAAIRKLIIWRSKSSFKKDDQSRAEDHRQDQKSSVANHAPPPSRSWWGKSTTNKGRDDLRNVLNKRHGRPLHPKPGASWLSFLIIWLSFSLCPHSSLSGGLF